MQKRRKKLLFKPDLKSTLTGRCMISSKVINASRADSLRARETPADFRGLAAAQYPEAVIISCSDSRVAPEILFDVGLGDIFVIRVAGNVVSGAGVTVKGSIEYGVAELNAPLIMVLGHTNCGALKAAKQHIDAKDSLPGAIDGLVELVKPAVAQSKGIRATRWKTPFVKMLRLGVERLKST